MISAYKGSSLKTFFALAAKRCLLKISVAGCMQIHLSLSGPSSYWVMWATGQGKVQVLPMLSDTIKLCIVCAQLTAHQHQISAPLTRAPRSSLVALAIPMQLQPLQKAASGEPKRCNFSFFCM